MARLGDLPLTVIYKMLCVDCLVIVEKESREKKTGSDGIELCEKCKKNVECYHYEPGTVLKEVWFTQFLFPKGQRRKQCIDRPEKIADLAVHLKVLGFSLEIENREESVWMTCINHSTEQSVDKFCANGPDVVKMVDELILEAYKQYVLGADT